MEAIILTTLKSFSNLSYKYYTKIPEPQLPKQKEHEQTPFAWKKTFSITYAKTKIMFLEKNVPAYKWAITSPSRSIHWGLQRGVLQLTHPASPSDAIFLKSDVLL